MKEETNISGKQQKMELCNKKRVLVVDDHKAVREVFRQVLAYELPFCSIDTAVDGAEAVARFRSLRNAVIVLDLNMPVMDGETAFREIERICATERIEMPSVLFCTGYNPSDAISRIISSDHTHGLLLKPITNDNLVNEIKKRLAA